MYKRDEALKKLFSNYYVWSKYSTLMSKLLVEQLQKSKPSITQFRSTPSITYCCHYSVAMVFRAGLLKQLSNHLHVKCHKI